MNDVAKIVNATIEILDKPYSIRCLDSELEALQKAAGLLNKRMKEVQESGKVINLERIAIISGLNLAHQYLQLEHQKKNWTDKINDFIARLQDKVESAEKPEPNQTEFSYSPE